MKFCSLLHWSFCFKSQRGVRYYLFSQFPYLSEKNLDRERSVFCFEDFFLNFTPNWKIPTITDKILPRFQAGKNYQKLKCFVFWLYKNMPKIAGLLQLSLFWLTNHLFNYAPSIKQYETLSPEEYFQIL